MTSFLSRITHEATAALSDAYGHVVYGDDAGSSARVVWVVHPRRILIEDINGGSMSSTATNVRAQVTMDRSGLAKEKNPVGVLSSNSPGRNMGSSSFLYTQKFDLGLTFLEINGRAYVRTVDPNSLAAAAGIQSQDCVQFACVVGGPQFEKDIESIHIREVEEEVKESNSNNNKKSHSASVAGGGGSSASSRGNDGGNRRKGSSTTGGSNNLHHRMETADLEQKRLCLDEKATQFAVECEKRGMRISYDELRDIFIGCALPPKLGVGVVKSVEAMNQSEINNRDSMTTPQRKNAPKTAALSTPLSAKRIKENNTNQDDLTIDDSNSLLMADSIGGMFETGRSKKHNTSSRFVPSIPDKTAKAVTHAARNAVGCFMPGEHDPLDNDNDGQYYGESNLRSRRNSDRGPLQLDTPSSPIKNARVSSPHRSSRGVNAGEITYGDNLLEQQLYPVVIVFRRTVQRKHLVGSRKGLWGSPGLSLRGSLFGIPSFRMDDECDRAAALIRHLTPNGNSSVKKKGYATDTSGLFYSDDGDNSTIAPSVATSTDHVTNAFSGQITDNIESLTIRGMISNALGLAFVRTSKVVMGVSLQAGSGIVIARLPDGTWSAPSAIGVYGLGVGMQFGLEVADYMFILQTKEGVDHFKRGGNFALGGNIGAAVANCGREAYGAASLGACTGGRNLEDQIQQGDSFEGCENDSSTLCEEQKKKKIDGDIAPMVAYARSQGLYFGVSVDGLKFFTRNDINGRAYKFAMLSEMAAKDILGGLVTPPPEAEDLYQALHSAEFTHEVIELPHPPQLLKNDSMNDWRFDRFILARNGEIIEDIDRNTGGPFKSFLSSLNLKEANECALFETKFKKFLYGGVAVQRLMPNALPTRSGLTRRERRTLWLMLPEVGSLRLGFVSRLKDDAGDTGTVDDVTMASSHSPSRTDIDDQTNIMGGSNIKLSSKYSMSLTDITQLSQDPNVTVRLSPDDATEHLRIVSIQNVTGKSLLFIAGSNREAELLVCGLKLLLEYECARLGVRGGNKLGAKLSNGALSPSSTRLLFKSRGSSNDKGWESGNRSSSRQMIGDLREQSKYSSIGEPGSCSDSSENNDEDDDFFTKESESARLGDRHFVPEGRRSWSQVPSRRYMREVASNTSSPCRQSSIPAYELGKAICSDIATNVSLSIPLALCRVLFLDATSPVTKAWEGRRGDKDFRRTEWTFPKGSQREFERISSEQDLISSGSMFGAKRTVSYSRMRSQNMVRLSETIIVERDDCQSLIFSIVDLLPRRGFCTKARVFIQSFGRQSCEARVVSELRPAGKNLSDQQAVHTAFVLVLDEMKLRYGAEGKGLIAVVLDVYSTIPGHNTTSGLNNIAFPTWANPSASTSNGLSSPSKALATNKASLTLFKDVLSHDTSVSNASTMNHLTNMNPARIPPPQQSPQRLWNGNYQERPSTPSMQTIESKQYNKPSLKTSSPATERYVAPQITELTPSKIVPTPKNSVTVEVKPLPKIRLDLCPVPREEDEEEDSSINATDVKMKKKSKHTRHRHQRKTSHI